VPKISQFFGIVIAMYYNDHPPPHFHARYSGQLSPRALGLVEEWRQRHVEDLAQNWWLAQQRKPLCWIEPLE